MTPKSQLELEHKRRTVARWQRHGLPAARIEHRFCRGRKWQFDFAFPQQRVAVEVQGGLFVRGRHTRGAALVKEYEKLRAAAMLGWRVLPIPPNGACSREFIGELKRALEWGQWDAGLTAERKTKINHPPSAVRLLRRTGQDTKALRI